MFLSNCNSLLQKEFHHNLKLRQKSLITCPLLIRSLKSIFKHLYVQLPTSALFHHCALLDPGENKVTLHQS